MEIISNGSKWIGQEPDDLETLMEVLQNYVLDPRFYEYGNFFYKTETGDFNAFGNFLELSHVFNIRGTLEELLPLARAIKQNRKTEAYLREWGKMHRQNSNPLYQEQSWRAAG